jgi:hypothetical protein
VHSNIKKIGTEYFIEDNDSTFGTLVQVQYPIFLSSTLFLKQPLVLQSGKSQLTINVMENKVKNNLGIKCLSCLNCFKKSANKKTSRYLATFDKFQYFPVTFVEMTQYGKNALDSERESKLSEKMSLS